jgi:hypothetical protein
MKDRQLAQELQLWFTRTALQRRRWKHNPVGRLLRQQLEADDHWKHQSRGDVNKAKAYSDAVKSGVDPNSPQENFEQSI